MLMILSYTFYFQAPILYQILILCLPLLTPLSPFILGFLLTDFLLILPKLNIYFQAIPSNGLNLFLLLFSSVKIFLHLLINVETLASFLIVILPLKITFLMSVAHFSITFVNFAKFVLLLTQISLSFMLTLLCLQNYSNSLSTIFLSNP